MKTNISTTTTELLRVWLNIVALAGVCLILIIAFYYQFALYELPCPLCLLQRVGIIIIGLAFLFNLCFGIKNSHYSLALIGCVLTGIIAIRQVFLHILPGDAGYGSTFLGIHFYTWSLIASVLFIIAIAVIMVFEAGENSKLVINKPLIAKIIITLFILLIIANLVSTLIECGGGQCADDPIFYQLLGH